jgi:hypothetical protein
MHASGSMRSLRLTSKQRAVNRHIMNIHQAVYEVVLQEAFVA